MVKRILLGLIKLGLLVGSLVLVVGLSAWITIRLSFLDRDVTVPDLTGLRVTEAGALAEEAGLKLVIKGERHSDRLEEHRVLWQDPDPGSKTRLNRRIEVVVSLGTRMIPVPALAGFSNRRAQMVLSQEDLTVGEVVWVDTPEGQENRVLAQDPPAELAVFAEQKVSLLVSAGPTPVSYVMPDFTGVAYEAVARRLQKRQIKLTRSEVPVTDPLQAGRVVGQYPLKGSRLFQHQIVVLRVGRWEDPDRQPGEAVL